MTSEERAREIATIAFSCVTGIEIEFRDREAVIRITAALLSERHAALEEALRSAEARRDAYKCVVPECQQWSDGAVYAANSIIEAIRAKIEEEKP
jgi:hypothetical protein